MHFCNRSNVGNLKPSQINCQKMQCKLIARGEEAVREGQLGTAAVSRNVGWWPTRRMHDVRQGKGGGGWGVQKESTVTANECHCEHDATCALYGGQAMDAIATKPVPVRGMAGTEQWGEREKGGGGRGASEWCMATATSHEATKSNCVATDCALAGPRGGFMAAQRGQQVALVKSRVREGYGGRALPVRHGGSCHLDS